MASEAQVKKDIAKGSAAKAKARNSAGKNRDVFVASFWLDGVEIDPQKEYKSRDEINDKRDVLAELEAVEIDRIEVRTVDNRKGVEKKADGEKVPGLTDDERRAKNDVHAAEQGLPVPCEGDAELAAPAVSAGAPASSGYGPQSIEDRLNDYIEATSELQKHQIALVVEKDRHSSEKKKIEKRIDDAMAVLFKMANDGNDQLDCFRNPPTGASQSNPVPPDDDKEQDADRQSGPTGAQQKKTRTQSKYKHVVFHDANGSTLVPTKNYKDEEELQKKYERVCKKQDAESAPFVKIMQFVDKKKSNDMVDITDCVMAWRPDNEPGVDPEQEDEPVQQEHETPPAAPDDDKLVESGIGSDIEFPSLICFNDEGGFTVEENTVDDAASLVMRYNELTYDGRSITVYEKLETGLRDVTYTVKMMAQIISEGEAPDEEPAGAANTGGTW